MNDVWIDSIMKLLLDQVLPGESPEMPSPFWT